MSVSETITAIATPPGIGGIGIVRISGPKAIDIAKVIWNGKDLLKIQSHYQTLGTIGTKSEIIDNAMATVMRAPKSYTGENSVEFSCHGGTLVLKKIVELLIHNGARLAEPGEFTKCAFLNGKMDLIQAEAVADIIHASSESSLKSAQEQLNGKLSNEILKIHEDLANLRAEIEATLDWPEEELNIDPKQVEPQIKNIIKKSEELLNTFEDGRIIREGLKLAIVGPPNVGKSSIFNMLLGDERAIVHHIPGTTRDVIEGDISINGVLVRLRDTAGLRDTEDEVESIGIDWAKKAIKWADACLLVLDSSKSIPNDIAEFIQDFPNDKTIAALNKSDLVSNINENDLSNFNSIKSSTINNQGEDKLKNMISQLLPKQEIFGSTLTNIRHKESLVKSIKHLDESLTDLSNNQSPDIIANHLILAQDSLGEITGKVTNTDILNRIFSRFCIGK